MEQVLVLSVLLPGAALMFFAISWLLGWNPAEAVIARLTAAVYVLTSLGMIAGAGWMIARVSEALPIHLFDWVQIGGYAFPFELYFDSVSLTMLTLTSVLTGIVAAFSRTYMHREAGYLRFFLLLHLFGFGAMLAFAAGTFDVLICGWELVGLSSVLLIAFFLERRSPVENAIRVYGIYRATDIGLLVGVFCLHHFVKSAVLPAAGGPGVNGTAALIVGGLLLFAAMGKAAQIPFSGWLPRAMEGPTPSSAIFYGAISVHLGAYLLLRARPYFNDSPIALVVLVSVGALTAIHGVIVGRACPDAKTSLAYASVAQLGVIFAEIGLGWTGLALLHIAGHSIVRTLQFLRAPSMLHEYHHIHAAAGGHLPNGDRSIAVLPAHLRYRFYWFALDRGHLDALLDRGFVRPLVKLSEAIVSLERRLVEPHGNRHAPATAARTMEEIDA